MRLFHGKTPEEGMLSALREEIPPPSRLNPEVSPAIDAVVLKSLMRERDSRYSTALELARAIEKAANGQLWHPEQSGELVQRHFVDRVQQTRQLIESTQGATGELTGELRVDSLLADLQAKNEMRESQRNIEAVKTPPIVMAVQPPPQDPGRQRASNVGVAPVMTAPPRQKESIRNTRPPPPPAGSSRENTETKEITDPAGNPATPMSMPGPRMSRPVMPVVALTAAPAQSVKLQGTATYDEDDVGAKTIPATMLPDGSFTLPETNNVHSRRTSPLPPPPVPSPPPPSPPRSAPPPPPISAIDSGTHPEPGTGPGTPTPMNSGWETYDDDDPGVKTTIARPFDDDHERRGRLPMYIGLGVGVGLLALLGLMFALDLGPFASKPPKSNTPTLRPAEDKPPKPEKAEKPPSDPWKAAPRPVEPVEAKPPPETPKPQEKLAVADTRVEEKEKPKTEEKAAPEAEPGASAVAAGKKDAAHPAKAPKRPRGGKKTAKADEDDDAPEPAAAPTPQPKPAPPPPAQPKPAAPASAATGTLTLVTEPPGLLVTLNGTEIGTTPFFNKTVPSGRQVFKVFGQSGDARSLPLDIRAGQPNSARQDFESLGR
jgi:hypothetical protein